MTSRRQYLINMAWSWAGAVLLIVNGVLVSPFFIRRLGTENYGIWALGLSLVEYFWVIDLGLRPATVKLTAEYRALGKWGALNSLLSTAIAYSFVMGMLILGVVSLSTGWISRFYRITDPSFPILVQVVAISWALGLVSNVFSAATEGFQRFDITNRIFIAFLALRNGVLVAIVWMGSGIAAMSIGLLITQGLMYLAFFLSFRRIYPELQVSARLINRNTTREVWVIARQMISAMLSARLLQAAVPTLIARYLSVRHVTYYSFVQKILDYAADGIGRVGWITTPRAADMMARGLRDEVVSLAETGNRYCLMLWMAFATFFFVYGGPLCRIWINVEIGEQAARLFPIMLTGYALWLGQFISSSILMGIARYGAYSASLMVEALLVLVGFALALPYWGLVGGALVASALMAANRCLNLSWLFCREFHLNQASFLWRTYRLPVAIGVIEGGLLWMLRNSILPGRTWAELIGVGAAHGVIFVAAFFSLVLNPEHRQLVIGKLMVYWRMLPGRGLAKDRA